LDARQFFALDIGQPLSDMPRTGPDDALVECMQAAFLIDHDKISPFSSCQF
jgi:hypothetical protein